MDITRAQKIRIEMIRKGIKTSDIARSLNLHRSTVNHTIRGELLKTPRTRFAIAKAIDMDYAALWGEYPPDDIV